MKTKSVVGIVMALCAVLSLTGFPVVAGEREHERRHERENERQKVSPLEAGIIRGADLQLKRQGKLLNGDTTDPTDVSLCSWEWTIGSGVANYNVQGPSARGLVDAYRVTGKHGYLYGAACAAQQMFKYYEANPTGKAWPDDVLLLTGLAEVTGDHSFASKASDYFKQTMASFSGAALADRYIDNDLSLSGWDLSAHISAALAVGQPEYARAIVLRVIERRAAWEHKIVYGWDFTVLSYGALLEPLSALKGKTIERFRSEILGLTLEAQAEDGSWDGGDYQVTAFALRGLLASKGHDARKAAANAVAFLLTTQTKEGGWAWGTTEYGEVNGEVLSALSAAMPDRDDDEHHDHDD